MSGIFDQHHPGARDIILEILGMLRRHHLVFRSADNQRGDLDFLHLFGQVQIVAGREITLHDHRIRLGKTRREDLRELFPVLLGQGKLSRHFDDGQRVFQETGEDRRIDPHGNPATDGNDARRQFPVLNGEG